MLLFPIGLAEAEDDETCIGVALHAFTNDHVEPSRSPRQR